MSIHEEWARCFPWIASALERDGSHDMADVKAMVLAEECQFWPGEKSAVVTELLILPKIRLLHIWLCGGDLEELVEKMLPQIEAFALRAGCTRISTAGREGWDRVLKPKGFKPAWTVSFKELTQ